MATNVVVVVVVGICCCYQIFNVLNFFISQPIVFKFAATDW